MKETMLQNIAKIVLLGVLFLCHCASSEFVDYSPSGTSLTSSWIGSLWFGSNDVLIADTSSSGSSVYRSADAVSTCQHYMTVTQQELCIFFPTLKT